MNMFRLVYILLVSFTIIGCSSDGETRPEYLDSSSVQALEIPPQLSQPDTSQALNIPRPSAEALKKLNSQKIAEGHVSPLFKGIKLESECGLYWLKIDQGADKLWPLLTDFWANEGIKLSREEPLLGFMETEWIKEYSPEKKGNVVTQWLNSFSSDELDKFRMRIERINNNSSRVYVSHRGLELHLEEDGTSWQVRPSDPVLEHEILKRLELFAGLSKAHVDQLFDDYKPYQSRIRKMAENNQYEIMGHQDFVWRRLQHALDRLGVELLSQNKAKGLIEVRVGKIADNLKVEEKDELAESSWIMNLFSSSEDEAKAVDIRLQLKPMKESSQLRLSLKDGSPIKSGLAESFTNSLVALLK